MNTFQEQFVDYDLMVRQSNHLEREVTKDKTPYFFAFYYIAYDIPNVPPELVLSSRPGLYKGWITKVMLWQQAFHFCLNFLHDHNQFYSYRVSVHHNNDYLARLKPDSRTDNLRYDGTAATGRAMCLKHLLDQMDIIYKHSKTNEL